MVALLFVVDHGALIVATKYLAWSFFSNPWPGRSSPIASDLDYNDFEVDEVNMSLKKVGFVNIPPSPTHVPLVLWQKRR